MPILLLIVVIALLVWWSVGMHNTASLERLKETGFEVDYVLESAPQIVFDDDQKKMGFVKMTEVLLYDYEQVLHWEWGTTERPGWSNKGESDEIQQITFYMKDEKTPTIRVQVLNQADLKQWKVRLNTLLGKSIKQRNQ